MLDFGKGKSWKSWVENKILEVRKFVDRCKWSPVAGGENKEDIPTRVCRIDDLER